MPHARLTHPDRPTVELRQGQQDELSTDAITNTFQQIGQDRPTLVHTESREGREIIRGRVTAPRRARNDPNTNDWLQANANYIDELEATVDEFQGDHSDGGYTLVNDQLSTSQKCIVESLTWRLTRGRPFDFEYELSVLIGRGTLENESRETRNPTPNTNMNVAAQVDGNDLPGLRQFEVSREIGLGPNALYNRDTAEENEAVIEAGQTERFVFRGTHSGTLSARQSADATLNGLVATADPITFKTRFPGYSVDGYVTSYSSNLENRFAGNQHQYALAFTVGERA